MHLTHTAYMHACQVCTCEGWHNTCSSAHYTCLSHNTVHLSVYHDTWQAVLYKAIAHMQCTCCVNARGVNCNTNTIIQYNKHPNWSMVSMVSVTKYKKDPTATLNFPAYTKHMYVYELSCTGLECQSCWCFSQRHFRAKEASAWDWNFGKIVNSQSWYLENHPFPMPELAEKPPLHATNYFTC